MDKSTFEMKNYIDFATITACGECCVGCKKREDGICQGCIESDEHCMEWTQYVLIRNSEDGGNYMRVYLCVNRGMGLELLKPTKHAKSNCIVCTQKQTAFKEFKGSITTEYIRESLGKTTNNKFPVMMFLLDIPYRNLVYVSGDELDPYTTEYESM